jgi:DNA-binding transcriptional ArsR family regulator
MGNGLWMTLGGPGRTLTSFFVSENLPFVDTYGSGRGPALPSPGARALTALGDPTRQAIVEQLAAGPLAVGELAQRLPISRPAVSQHLKVLTEAGVVGHRALGTRRVYHLDPAGILVLRGHLEGFWNQALRSFAALAEDTYPAHPPLVPPEEP